MTWLCLKVLTWTSGMLKMNSMRPIRRYTLCSCIFLACVCSSAFAQDDFINSSAQQESMKYEGHVEKKYVIKLESAPPPKRYCHVSVSIGYLQTNASAVVDVTLDNPDCAASSGSYAVAVKFRDQNKDSQTLEFEEKWQRDDDKPLETQQDYYMGNNVDLVSVRVRKPKCVCTELPTAENDELPPTTTE
jgi:hypothetical protein